MLTLEEERLFTGKPVEAELYEALAKRLQEALPPYDLRVQKTQITMVNPNVFLCISFKWKNCITVTFGLPDCISSPRIHQAIEVRHGRWTHHVKLSHPDEMDDELIGWLRAVYLFAAR